MSSAISRGLLQGALLALAQPVVVRRAVPHVGAPDLLHVLARVLLGQVGAVGTDLLDHVERQRLVVDDDAAGDLLHDAVDLGLHDHVRVAQDLGAVEQPAAVHHVGAAHDAGEGAQRVVDGGLPVGLLGAGRHGAHGHRHAVEVGELGGGGGEQVVLGRAAGVAAGLEVDDARRAGEEGGRAGIGELQEDDAAEGLGVLHDEVAGERRGTGAGAERHRHEAAGQAVLGGHEVGLEVGAVVAERVDGALHEAQDRAARAARRRRRRWRPPSRRGSAPASRRRSSPSGSACSCW